MIERTFDYRRIKRITNWQPIVSSQLIYLIDVVGDKDLGVWSFHEYFDEGLLIHADMTRDCRGKRAVESAENAFKWIFKNTEFKTIYAKISTEKRAASYIAIASGMEFTYSQNNERHYQVNKHGLCS